MASSLAEASHPTGLAGCGAAFPAEFELEFGEGGHDSCDDPPCRGSGIDAFT